jgi:hypothetical protein
LPFALLGQEHRFDVVLLNKKIGTTTIKKVLENGGERYQLFSQTVAKVMFIKKESEIQFDVFFKGGQLLNSLYSIEKEDESIKTIVKKTANNYSVISGAVSRNFTGAVPISSIHLYFKEPVGVSKIFVERLGDFLPITKNAPGQYEYVLPDGIKNIYKYRNGALYEVEIKKGAGSVYMRPATV